MSVSLAQFNSIQFSSWLCAYQLFSFCLPHFEIAATTTTTTKSRWRALDIWQMYEMQIVCCCNLASSDSSSSGKRSLTHITPIILMSEKNLKRKLLLIYFCVHFLFVGWAVLCFVWLCFVFICFVCSVALLSTTKTHTFKYHFTIVAHCVHRIYNIEIGIVAVAFEQSTELLLYLPFLVSFIRGCLFPTCCFPLRLRVDLHSGCN